MFSSCFLCGLPCQPLWVASSLQALLLPRRGWSPQVDGGGLCFPLPLPPPLLFVGLSLLLSGLSLSGLTLARPWVALPSACSCVLRSGEWLPQGSGAPECPTHGVGAALVSHWEWERFTLPKCTVSPLEFLKIKVYFWCQYAIYLFCFFFKLW